MVLVTMSASGAAFEVFLAAVGAQWAPVVASRFKLINVLLFYIEVYMVIQGPQLLHGDQWTFSQKNGSGHHTPLGSLLAVELAALAACCAHCCQAFLFSCALRAQLH